MQGASTINLSQANGATDTTGDQSSRYTEEDGTGTYLCAHHARRLRPKDSATNVGDDGTGSVLSTGAVSRAYSTLPSTNHRSSAVTSPSSRKHKHRDSLARRKAQISRFLVEAVNKHDLALWLLQQSNGAWQMYSDHLAMYRNELEGRCLGRGVSLTSSKNPLDCFDGESLDLRTLVCDVNSNSFIFM
jgi:hypothetical protein